MFSDQHSHEPAGLTHPFDKWMVEKGLFEQDELANRRQAQRASELAPLPKPDGYEVARHWAETSMVLAGAYFIGKKIVAGVKHV